MAALRQHYLRFLIGSIFLLMLLSGMARALGEIVFVLPDNVVASDPRASVWIDAAQEEGLRLKVMQDTQLLQLLNSGTFPYPGIIMPDQVHVRASDSLVAALNTYVSTGGRLMLVYDAGALNDAGFYPVPKSRFSGLAGVDYVLYDELRDFTVGWGPIVGLDSRLRQTQVPPGKSMPYPPSTTLSTQTTTSSDISYFPSTSLDPGGLKGYDHGLFMRVPHEYKQAFKTTLKKPSKVISGKKVKSGSYTLAAATTADTQQAISGYVYGYLSYPSYVTRGSYTGDVILTAPNFGLAAGVNTYGSGKVLFVNLPLGYLAGQTDGMLLHGFLRYFSTQILGLPRLADHPAGRAGLVLNWHLDYADALGPMQELKNQGVWNNGPFSVHITAGPDTISIGDGLGLNVPGNTLTQDWIRYYVSKGHQVGSHGGWIHDYYGINANETNETEFLPYLVLNKQAIEAVSKKAVIEYSSPEGNNPKWAMNWLEANGIIGAYFTGHTGLGPTRHYREGVLMNPSMWLFPVTTFGKYATFEEFDEFNVSAADVTSWYMDLIDFSLKNRTSRLIYMHPPGAADYPTVVKAVMDRARQLQQTNQFRWYTMAQLAQFETQRKSVTWKIENVSLLGLLNQKQITATHPSTLKDMTWLLPKSLYSMPYVVQGLATISGDTDNWVVTALSGKTLRFNTSTNSL